MSLKTEKEWEYIATKDMNLAWTIKTNKGCRESRGSTRKKKRKHYFPEKRKKIIITTTQYLHPFKENTENHLFRESDSFTSPMNFKKERQLFSKIGNPCWKILTCPFTVCLFNQEQQSFILSVLTNTS